MIILTKQQIKQELLSRLILIYLDLLFLFFTINNSWKKLKYAHIKLFVTIIETILISMAFDAAFCRALAFWVANVEYRL